MSYSLTIEGSVDNPDAEHALAQTLQTFVDDPANGVTAATGTFQFAGDVVFIPGGNTPPPPPTVDELLDTVTADVAVLDPSAAKDKLTTDVTALVAAVRASESAAPSPSSDTPPADAPVVDHEGTAVAL